MDTVWSTIGPGALAPVLAWLATYLVHSTLLLGGAWGVARWLRRRDRPGRLALEERIWKTALLGGLLTAGVQIGLGALPQPLATALPVPAVVVPAVSSAAPSVGGVRAPGSAPAASGIAPIPAAVGTVRPDPRLASLAALLPGWQRMALAGWLLGALALSAVFLSSWIRLRLHLRRRLEVGSGPARRALDRLLTGASRRRVRLTGSGRLPVPVALGVGEREICLPRRALAELDERQQEGLIAHELAHLERRDPAWLLAGRTLENLFFFQPLNRVARRRLQEISEYRSDAWAVAATGDRVGLARCLAEVAGWLADGRHAAPVPGPVPGMARGRRNLGKRVRRILEPSESSAEEGAIRRPAIVVLAVALTLTTLLAPGLTPSSLALETAPAKAPVAGAGGDPAGPAPAAPGPEEAAAAAASSEGTQSGEPNESSASDRGRGSDRDPDRDLDRGLDRAFDPAELTAAVERMRAAIPDPAELAELEGRIDAAVRRVAETQGDLLDSQHRALEELQRALDRELSGLSEPRELSAQERRELRDQLRKAAEKARREAEVARPSADELRELQELSRRLAAQARPDREEIERMNREIQDKVRAELERTHREVDQTNRALRAESLRQARDQQREMHQEVQRKLEEAQRQLDAQRREIESQRRDLERERKRVEQEREKLRQERQERHEGGDHAPPSASSDS